MAQAPVSSSKILQVLLCRLHAPAHSATHPSLPLELRYPETPISLNKDDCLNHIRDPSII